MDMSLNATDFRHHLTRLAELVSYKEHRVVMRRHGRDVAVLVSWEDFEFLTRYRPLKSEKRVQTPPEYLVPQPAEPNPFERVEAARKEAETRAAEEKRQKAEAEKQLTMKLRTSPEYLPLEEVKRMYAELNRSDDDKSLDWRLKAWTWLNCHCGVNVPFVHELAGHDKVAPKEPEGVSSHAESPVRPLQERGSDVDRKLAPERADGLHPGVQVVRSGAGRDPFEVSS